VAATTAAVAGVTLLDLLCGQQLSRSSEAPADRAVHVSKSLTINRPAAELYQFWRNFQNLPLLDG
jgi:uncharacterized membrane protein